MGSKNPLVVLDDADLATAVNVAVQGAYFSTGQRCTASSRLIVTEGIHDRFVAALTERLAALKVDNADEIWDANTDDEGKFIPLGVVANQARDQFALRGGATGATDPVGDEGEPAV